MSRVLMLMLKDGLQTASGFLAEADYYCLIYCRVPDEWVIGEIPESSEMWLKGFSLAEDKLEKVFQMLYGATWREGNSDGSQYVVLSVGTRLLNPQEMERPWQLDDLTNKQFHYFYFIADPDGKFRSVSREKF